MRARYYNPAIGRFISEDSYWGEAGDPLSLNMYVYCVNNPVNYQDPSGHNPGDNYMEQYDLYETEILENYGDYSNTDTPLSGYELVGTGIQLDITIAGLGDVGVEVVWYNDKIESDGPVGYWYYGVSLSTSTPLDLLDANNIVGSAVDIIKNYVKSNTSFDKIDPKHIANEMKSLKDIFKVGSVSMVKVYGDLRDVNNNGKVFSSPDDYLGGFVTESYSAMFVNNQKALGNECYSVSTGLTPNPLPNIGGGLLKYNKLF